MHLDPEDRAMLALHLAPGIGPRLLRGLLDRFGTASSALAARPEEWQSVPHLWPKVAQDLSRFLNSADVDAELALLEKHAVRVVRCGSEQYPAALANVPVPPPLLFVKGDLDPADTKAIAIVGSRTCTHDGKRCATKLARELAHAGWTIVSGLARGIDACAHRGALEAGGKTLAVLAGGLAKIYPPEHAELAEQVANQGALITESSMRMEPMSGLFPARNRIISGLSKAIVVVEANENSGARITARHAIEQGREVFVLPGPVDSATWAGSNELLRQGARLARNAKDIIEDLGGLAALTESTLPAKPPPKLEGPALRLWECLERPTGIDDLAEKLAQPVAALSGLLMQLELTGVVRRLPGNVYERKN